MDIFLKKINKIRTKLDTHPLYDPPQRDLQCELDIFIEMTHEDVHSIVMKTTTMYCNSNPFPTNFIKLNLDILILIITNLVKKSLTSGEFLKDWKISIIKPLIKVQALTFPTIDPSITYLSFKGGREIHA